MYICTVNKNKRYESVYQKQDCMGFADCHLHNIRGGIHTRRHPDLRVVAKPPAPKEGVRMSN